MADDYVYLAIWFGSAGLFLLWALALLIAWPVMSVRAIRRRRAVPQTIQGEGCTTGIRTKISIVGMTLAGIILPLLTFPLSRLTSLDHLMKTDPAYRGLLGGLHAGTIILLPLLIWASNSIYTLEICRTPLRNFDQRHRARLVVGMLLGLGISTSCFVIDLFLLSSWGDREGKGFMVSFLVILLFIMGWYAVACMRLLQNRWISLPVVMSASSTTAGSWVACLLLGRAAVQTLPTKSSCFVVTAAARGHAWITGPTLPVSDGGNVRLATTQLLTFWALETLWHRHFPGSHRMFRAFYNVWGYRLSLLVRNRWTADFACICLKPLELAARTLLALAPASPRYTETKAPTGTSSHSP